MFKAANLNIVVRDDQGEGFKAVVVARSFDDAREPKEVILENTYTNETDMRDALDLFASL
jgi:hypothetical protein